SRNDAVEISELLRNHRTLLPQILHFQLLNRQMQRLEDSLHILRSEHDTVFEDMTFDNLDDALGFFCARKRWECLRPYQRSVVEQRPRPDTPFPSPSLLHQPFARRQGTPFPPPPHRPLE